MNFGILCTCDAMAFGSKSDLPIANLSSVSMHKWCLLHRQRWLDKRTFLINNFHATNLWMRTFLCVREVSTCLLHLFYYRRLAWVQILAFRTNSIRNKNRRLRGSTRAGRDMLIYSLIQSVSVRSKKYPAHSSRIASTFFPIYC